MKICVLAISIIALSAISTCREITNHRTFKNDQEPIMNWLKRSQDQDTGISLFNERRGLAMGDDGLFKKRGISSNTGFHLRRVQEDPPISWFQERQNLQDPPVTWFNERRQDEPISLFRQDPTTSAHKEEDEDAASLSLFRRENHANSKLSKGKFHPQYKIKASLFKGILSSKRNDEFNSAILNKDSRSNRKFYSRKSHDNSEMLKLKV